MFNPSNNTFKLNIFNFFFIMSFFMFIIFIYFNFIEMNYSFKVNLKKINWKC